ncbi:hypothetical protein Hanom_Chr15g01355271 [Helianthus anomalus]
MHFLFLYNTHLYSLHVKPDKTHNIIELGLSRGREGPLARKAPFRAKGPCRRNLSVAPNSPCTYK